MTKTPMPIFVFCGLCGWFVLTFLGMASYGLFMAFVTAGELTYWSNLLFAFEIAATYGVGIAIAISLEFWKIRSSGTSLFARPVFMLSYMLIAVTGLTLIEFSLPQYFTLHDIIAYNLQQEDNRIVALVCDFVAASATLIVVGFAYNIVLWRFFNERFRWVEDPYQLRKAFRDSA